MLKTLNALVNLAGLALFLNGVTGGAHSELWSLGFLMMVTSAVAWVVLFLGAGQGGENQLTAFGLTTGTGPELASRPAPRLQPVPPPRRRPEGPSPQA